MPPRSYDVRLSAPRGQPRPGTLYVVLADEPPPPADDLFHEHLPILFLEGMAYLHTAITPDLDITDLVCFAYPSDVTMHATEEQLGQLFTTLVRLHRIVDSLTRAMLESATTYVPPLGFLWLIRAWQNAWDVGART